MNPAASAVAGELRRRHRAGLFGLVGYLLVLGLFKLTLFGPGRVLDLRGESAEPFAAFVVVPLTTTCLYVLAVFSYGLSGDIAGRASIFPTRLFTLPVSTEELVRWPMLYGSVFMALLWFVARPLVPWPHGVPVPVIWPAFLGAAMVAWAQALTWMPYGLPWLRIAVTILALSAMEGVVLLALERRTPEWQMALLIVPSIPVAYFLARHAVARARRGEVPDWSTALARVTRLTDLSPRHKAAFASPAEAQAWFEWQRHGRSLPALVVALLPFELALVFLGAAVKRPGLVLFTLMAVLVTPPLLAALAAATVRTSGSDDAYSLGTFLATRPLTSAELVAAKLRMTIRSTLVAWLLVFLALPLALTLSGSWSVVRDVADRVVGLFGTPRATVLGVLVVAGLMASTWKRLVQGLYIGLIGREWAVRASVLALLAFLFAAVPGLSWLHDSFRAKVWLWLAAPWALSFLVLLKTGAGAWFLMRLHRNQLVEDRVLLAGAVCWLATVLAVYSVLSWLANHPMLPRYLFGLVAILEVPLVRLSAATPALAWNRHR